MTVNKAHSPITPLGRLPSGIHGLDTILNGGFVAGGVYLLLGPPGAGKTVLANQICFHHAKNSNASVVYVTLLAESHGRMIANLSTLDYFEDGQVATNIHYMSGYPVLEKEGLKGFLKLVAGIVREKKASILMIDGMSTIGELEQSAITFRKFTHELNSYLSTSGCTAFLLSSMDGHLSKPEHTMVDGIVCLYYMNVGARVVRQLEVRKFRGSAHFYGRHNYSISNEGIRVFVRTEAFPQAERLIPHISDDRLLFGVKGLDKMIGGGVICNSITTLLGVAGTGKTTLALQFLAAGGDTGQKGLYFGFNERPNDLLEKADALKVNLREHVDEGNVEIIWRPALEQEIDELGERLFEAVIRFKAQRVVIDGVEGFRQSAADKERVNVFFNALVSRLKSLGTTVVIIEESSLFGQPRDRLVAEMSSLNENLLLFRNVDMDTRLVRIISAVKIRNTSYDHSAHTYEISNKGIAVLGPIVVPETTLTKNPRSVKVKKRPVKKGRA